jgi:hypothetical protein
MDKIKRYEFMGSWPLFWLLCVIIILLPIAFLYLISNTIIIESEVSDSEMFFKKYKYRNCKS